MSRDATPLGAKAVEALSGLRLLVVEDDEMVRDIMVRTADGCGIEVDAAADGGSATALLADNDYDIVMTDLKMPGVSGSELMGRVLVTHPKTALIVVTGFAQGDIEERVSRSGGLLLHKPFNLATMVDALHWAKDRREKLLEP